MDEPTDGAETLTEAEETIEEPGLPEYVTIGEHRVRLAPPARFSICSDVAGIKATSVGRAYFAALGLCWRSPKKPAPKAVYAYDALAYGGQVMDELVSKYPWDELVEAAGIAYEHILQKGGGQMVLTEEKVQSAEDFTGPPQGE